MSEKICVKSTCSVFGQECPHSSFAALKEFTVDIDCNNLKDVSLNMYGQKTTEPLQQDSLWTSSINSNSDYCCNNDNTKEFNSTFLEVFGHGCFDNWRDVKRSLQRCRTTNWIQGKCEKESREIYRMCLVSDGGCDNVIREYYNTLCSDDNVLPHCANSRTLCM